ncbi:uncharacterized protein LOC129718075 [Wyeomyia smithii]|uniref:uncharacterized protein LOC129718075 n=1 Tax=Wyeomyia smithii TaxID=174621 RepID=UPI002467E4FF|nr:uncharacterized protein LOC129718075 [Wyeomyia smithii]
MTQETFYEYLKNVFHPWLLRFKVAFPILLFVDGHRSHVSLQTTEFCKEKQTVLICLFPNSTHVLQPLDVAFFRGLKVKWNKRLIDWRTFRAGESLKRHDFAPLLKRAVDMVNLSPTLCNGFRKCGLYPWNPDAVNYAMLLQNKTPQTSASTAQKQPISDTNNEFESKNVLLGLKSYLTVGQLKRFEDNYSNTIRTGPVGDTNLFYVWQTIKRESNEQHSTIQNEKLPRFSGFHESEIRAGRLNVQARFASFEQQAISSQDDSVCNEQLTEEAMHFFRG